MNHDETEPTVFIPGAFLKAMSPDEWMQVLLTSTLNSAQCARLWHLQKYTGNPPARLTVLMNADDVEDLIAGRGHGIEVRGRYEQ